MSRDDGQPRSHRQRPQRGSHGKFGDTIQRSLRRRGPPKPDRSEINPVVKFFLFFLNFLFFVSIIYINIVIKISIHQNSFFWQICSNMGSYKMSTTFKIELNDWITNLPLIKEQFIMMKVDSQKIDLKAFALHCPCIIYVPVIQ